MYKYQYNETYRMNFHLKFTIQLRQQKMGVINVLRKFLFRK